MRHGKKPTRKQKIRLSQVGLSPENWLVMNQKQDGELVIIHKHTDKISMKSRLEIQTQQAIERGYEVDQLKAEIKKLNSGIDELIQKDEERKAAIVRLEKDRDDLMQQRLSENLRRDLWVMVTTEAEASRARMAEAADKMVSCANNPGCVLFENSVAIYRSEKTRAETMEQRAAELDELEPKTEK